MLVGAAVIINSIIMDIIQGSMEVVPLEMPTLEEVRYPSLVSERAEEAPSAAGATPMTSERPKRLGAMRGLRH